uniref:Uncharacterized protein n=1 Tax=Meloidogyne enterolobii TaxID=390850 RepID=A0A6V7WNA6_MELEN|nr:unnamed protein product [Meloidogyne enterolobii]
MEMKRMKRMKIIKRRKKTLKKTMKQQDINQHKQYFTACEDEIKEFGEESKYVNESVEEQGTNNIKNQQQKFPLEEDDTSSFSSASTLFTSNNNFSSSSLQNSFKIKRKAIVERQFSRKSVTFRKDSFIQKLDKNIQKEEDLNLNKNSMQFVSKLFGFVRGKLGRCSMCCNANQRVVKEENDKTKIFRIEERREGKAR